MRNIISVIIPTYNRRKLVTEAIQSVLTQKPNNYEIIVVDDGSTDGTFEKIKSLQIKNLTILKQKNQGVSAARNTGIKHAKSEYIAFLDSDDLWLPNFLKELLSHLKHHPDIILVYADQFLKKKGRKLKNTQFSLFKPLDAYLFPGFLSGGAIHMSGLLVRKKVFDKVGLFNEALLFNEDIDFFNRVSEISKLGFVDKALVLRRLDIDPNHLTSPHNRKLYVEHGKKYLQSYVERNKHTMTSIKRAAIEDSRFVLDYLDKTLSH